MKGLGQLLRGLDHLGGSLSISVNGSNDSLEHSLFSVLSRLGRAAAVRAAVLSTVAIRSHSKYRPHMTPALASVYPLRSLQARDSPIAVSWRQDTPRLRACPRWPPSTDVPAQR